METFKKEGKTATLYRAKEPGKPLIILNNYDGDGSSVLEEAEKLGGQDFNLLCVGTLDWNHDMTPWYCPPLSPRDTACTGGADEYLQLLLEEILPECLKRVDGAPPHIGIAGYSLAGLFALYALYRTDVFARAASMSGSLWYPDFKEYALCVHIARRPKGMFFWLGHILIENGSIDIGLVSDPETYDWSFPAADGVIAWLWLPKSYLDAEKSYTVQ
jgi:hypothetical protein